MADKAHEQTDEILAEIERQLTEIYARAERELQETAEKYFTKFAALDEAKRKMMEQGKITEDEYKAWRKRKLMTGKRYLRMKQQCAEQLLHVNETAVAYVNGRVPEIYSLNYNATRGDFDGVGGYSFELVDADTVKHLATTDKILLPYKVIDPAKDIPWNSKKINAEVLQGIVQGESVYKIAKRLKNVQEMNQAQAIRTARTIVTGAENKGRQDSYERAEKDGIIMEREWIATDDRRTRHWHAELNGVSAGVDEPFVNAVGAIMYPGDPSAHPSNVYNCRCTMRARILGFRKIQGG